ncbi:GTP 3',8-cyclase MoaA [Sphingobacterium sp. 1.A.5]|uniref:GTP 3',8-cyclase MoaA n=1 Tax=Sphingobacterium sp. 1.A.5 TaxID=2044604 RepID=UPI001C558A8F|nr:GTP 3',8-cyclase MoaA [Sphingobacterium sp. 1.A.5]
MIKTPMMLKDKFGREIDYLRLAVIDRCNLRCTYCMPAEGLNWLSKNELMSNEEMLRICRIFTEMGVSKIRITGGEPFLRKGIMPFLNDLTQLNGLKNIAITTNGLNTFKNIQELKNLGIKSINLSLDSLDSERFFQITRRDELSKVLDTLDQLIENQFEVKVNTVVMDGVNTADIYPLVELTKNKPISVRFIEEMPFNGGTHEISLKWDANCIIKHIQSAYPKLDKIEDERNSTAMNFNIPGYQGNIGIIAAYTRNFCGSCNRLRLTSVGELRTCLYQSKGINLRDLMRQGNSDQEIKEFIELALIHKPKDGWEAEKQYFSMDETHQSMASIGG